MLKTPFFIYRCIFFTFFFAVQILTIFILFRIKQRNNKPTIQVFIVVSIYRWYCTCLLSQLFSEELYRGKVKKILLRSLWQICRISTGRRCCIIGVLVIKSQDCTFVVFMIDWLAVSAVYRFTSIAALVERREHLCNINELRSRSFLCIANVDRQQANVLQIFSSEIHGMCFLLLNEHVCPRYRHVIQQTKRIMFPSLKQACSH